MSSPAESHRQALPEPDVNLSIHPAPIVQPLTNGLVLSMQVLPSRVAHGDNTERRRPFGPVPLQNVLPYYERLRPCAPPRYSGACGGYPLARLPLHRSDRFLRSSPMPESRSRRLHAGRQWSRRQVPLHLLRGIESRSRFRRHVRSFDTSSAVHLRSSS